MKPPPANTSPEAIVLREAAIDFVKNAGLPASDQSDRAGQRRNCALLKAAVEYAGAAKKAPR